MPVIQFPGKYVYKPGNTKGVDLMFQNNTGRSINDLLIYVFPNSSFIDTPDIINAKVTSQNRTVIEVFNQDPVDENDADDDLDEIKIARIEPAIEDKDLFQIVIDFEDEFEGDEGIAIIGTWNNRAIGSTDPATAAEDIPDGPSAFDLVIELAKQIPISTLLGQVQNNENSASNTALASAITKDKRFSQGALLEVASIMRNDSTSLQMILESAKNRPQKKRRRITLNSA